MRAHIHISYVSAVAICCCIWSGCEGPPPNHCANWWYYWKEGGVVQDMDKVKYLWNPGDTLGVASPHKTQDFVGVSDLALDPVDVTYTFRNFYNIDKTVTIVRPRDGGIDGVAEVIAHEFKHVWIYQQWGARIGQTGTINGQRHSDGDAIPDIVELDRTGPIGQYEFSPQDPDSYRLVRYNPIYERYGDNEILARVEGLDNPRQREPQKDWSQGGKQWGR